MQLKIQNAEAKSWYKDEHNTRSQEMAPSKAHDGDYNTYYSVKDGETDDNFLKLYLEMVYHITRVKVTNRLDGCCAQRIVDTVVKVQLKVAGSVTDIETCGTITGEQHQTINHSVFFTKNGRKLLSFLPIIFESSVC